MYLFENVLM